MTTQVPARLASFAIVSAIEEDLRAVIRQRSTAGSMLTAESKEKALRRAPGSTIDTTDDSQLLDYADFGDLAASLRQIAVIGDSDASTAAGTIEKISPSRNRVCHSRPLEPEDFPLLLEGADSLIGTFGASTMVKTASARERLATDPAFVFAYSIPEYWRDDSQRPVHNLPLPEFDDTGFLGRVRDRKELTRRLTSSYPVVTVVGEGGIGKTALALRCLYDLVDLGESQPFDYIIWVSLKASRLTASGIVEIKNAITTELGLFQSVTNVMGVPNPSAMTEEDLLSEIGEYLRTFKVLLAIDNLETLDVAALRPLLLDMPPGSKLLLTSRVGLGEFEVRYPLDALAAGEAKGLMRRYAQTLNVQSLLKYPEPHIDRFVTALFGNPLLIKWFVSGIAAGGAPDQIIFGRRTFEEALTFCFENLFERLDHTSRRVLHVIAAARRPLTRGQALLIGELSSDSLDGSLTVLHNSSMLRRLVVGDASMFSLTDIADKYLSKVAPPPADLMSLVSKKLVEIRHLTESNQVGSATFKYEWSVIEYDRRNADQVLAAATLRRATRAQKKGDYVDAEEMIRRARDIAPAFSETYRIQGSLDVVRNRIYPAGESYRQAVDLNPNSAKARYALCLFLLDHGDDNEEALSQIEAALEIEPGNITLTTARARTLTYLGRYQEASALYDTIVTKLYEMPSRGRIVTRDQAAEAWRRMIEVDSQMNDEPQLLTHLSSAFAVLLDGYRQNEWDGRTLFRLQRVVDLAARFAVQRRASQCAKALSSGLRAFGPEIARQVLTSERWLQRVSLTWPEDWPRSAVDNIAISTRIAGLVGDDADEEEYGTIQSKAESFGFLSDDADGEKVFFHLTDVEPSSMWGQLQIGNRVRYRRIDTLKGRAAKRVQLLD